MSKSNLRSLPVVAVLAIAAFSLIAQQPNSGFSSMQVNGSDLGSYPIFTNVRTNLPAIFSFAGATNQVYVVFQTGAAPAVGTAFIPASNSLNSVDLPLSPFPAMVIDGFSYPVFSTDSTGTGTLVVTVPPHGTPPNGIPLGTQLTLQGFLTDPFSSLGATLTAATRITVTQGPTVTNYTLGDESFAAVSTPSMPLPFYGSNFTTLHVNSNGYICFGATDGGGFGDFTPSIAEFTSGPPRMAAFWTDLDCPTNAVKVTVDTPQGFAPGYVRVDYINAQTWALAQTHNFSMLIQSDGYLEIIYPTTNNPSLYDQITGIGPGTGMGGSTPQKNFTGPQLPPPGSVTGAGILSTSPFTYVGNVNEPFIEWFGIVTQHLYYGNSYNNPYDLFATTLRFTPGGTGNLPGASNRYTLY